MTNFDNVLGSISRGGPGAIRYDGDSLTNDEEHQYRINVAEMLEHDTELISFPSDVGSGAAIVAAEEKINEVRSLMLKIADGFRTIGEAAKDAAPAIRSGTAADPEVQDALRRSSAAYESIKDIVPPEEAGPKIDGFEPDPGVGKRSERSPEPEAKPKEEVSPRTNVSADQPAQPMAAPGQGPMAPGPMQGAPAAQGPMAGPAGGPTTAPSAFVPGTGPDGRPYGTTPRPNRRGAEPGPTTYGSSLSDGSGGVAPMPLVNPSVTGGRVDPAQISGRTASTSPSAGLPPLKTGPTGSTGMMGGMGAMPMGGGMGGPGGSARPDLPPLRRDRASERILTGEEARDKALVSHILRDDDPPAGEYIDSAELADLLPDERHPSAPQRSEPEPPALRDVPPPAPVVMNVPPPASVVMDVPPAPAPPRLPGRDQPVQYPGEPRDDEKW
ncbi:hypothetical protein H7J87_12100 [Mycolicibacterium wolinskyi]|uniref:Uncharacterized protein n=1 Tax=Mycolicibacterium wolinskyi TaxID=59750 RepID=A0A1X2FJD1_9MYCO|nr:MULTISPECIES: hypothetical protein [Mycolicibacterium]MCV7286074.1 hypothetical protein [Mycolicibacterium wolinskyi]MCV7296270.1 hypothetical protein [Mycolicibacterium goodii]ORX18497.1 hypothetical protein AWC31_14440 [Mycolicibacterium wolinskyi]